MITTRAGVIVVVTLLLLTACRRDDAAATGRPAATATAAVQPVAGGPAGVSDEELVAFVTWQREHAELLGRHLSELDAVGRDDPPGALMRESKAFDEKIAAAYARQLPVMKALRDRIPLRGAAAELATEAVGGIFRYSPDGRKLVVARDEVRLDVARRRFGKEAVDGIVSRESLILTALGAVGAGNSGINGIPTPEQLDEYVSGAGALSLGMTEAEVTKALGKQPSRRDDGAQAVAWVLNGPRRGAALGRFRDDRLYSIEFTPAEQDYPRLDYSTAEPFLIRAEYAIRAVEKTLRLADIEAVTRVRGYRAAWGIMAGFGSPTRVQSKWLWEVDPGDRILYVEELDGIAGQPIIRSKGWGKAAISAGF